MIVHMLNLKALSQKVVKNKRTNLYHRINDMFKGATWTCDKKLISEIRDILVKEHTLVLKYLDEMKLKAEKVEA